MTITDRYATIYGYCLKKGEENMETLTTCEKTFGFLSGSTLKLIACISMFMDHFGLVVFPKVMIFRILGRLAFPIFAYFIAEGCKYTRNRLKHFLLIFSGGIIYFFFYLIAFRQVYPSVFLTFSFSIINVYLIDEMKKFAFAHKNDTDTESAPRVKLWRVALAFCTAASALAVSYIPFHYVRFDYGYVGMLAPVLLSLVDFSKIKVPKKLEFLDTVAMRLVFLTVICIALQIRNQQLSFEMFGNEYNVQVFNLLAIPLLAFYNGKVGAKKLKYFFYAFYPVHLGVIMGIKILLDLIFK